MFRSAARWTAATTLVFMLQPGVDSRIQAADRDVRTASRADHLIEEDTREEEIQDSLFPLTSTDDIWNAKERTRKDLFEESPDDSLQLISAEDFQPLEAIPDLVGTTESDPSCASPCYEFWEHRSNVWGEFLFLRPRGADVVYATPVDGTLATSVPVANQALAGLDYSPGFRVGAAWAIDSCSSFTASYMWLQSASRESTAIPFAGSFLRADTVHPNTVNVAADSLAANTNYHIFLNTGDVNYKSVLDYGDCHVINYLVGVKYARLDQEFEGIYSITGTTKVDSDVLFDGTGPRFGIDTERLLGCRGFMVFTRANVNFLVGSCIADYRQTNVFAGTQAQTGLTDTRVVTMPELELGAGWQGCEGRFRITAGYYLSAWFNMMTTTEYLSTVRTTPNTFQPETKTLTLDGLTVRTEYRF